MKALIFILALSWANVPAFGSDAEDQAKWEQGEIVPINEQPATTTVATLVNVITRRMSAAPAKGSIAAIDGMTPFQKVDGGYLVRLHPVAVTDTNEAYSVAFLKTKQQLHEDDWLRGKVRFTGTTSYQSIVGFERNVLSFEEIKNDPIKVGLP